VKIIRETHVGTDKHTIFYRNAVIDGYIILNFDIIADDHIGVDVDPFPEDAILANPGPRSHLSMMPDTAVFPNCRFC
jgi:hypothetical protein